MSNIYTKAAIKTTAFIAFVIASAVSTVYLLETFRDSITLGGVLMTGLVAFACYCIFQIFLIEERYRARVESMKE